MLHITFSKYDCIIVHKAYYSFTCTCVSINSFHSHSHSHSHHLSSKGGFIFLIAVSCIVSLHSHLSIYCCTIHIITCQKFFTIESFHYHSL